MLPRERVIEVIEHRTPDRLPIYAWVRENLEEPITKAFGSVEAFEDHYEFDFAHLFGGPAIHKPQDLQKVFDETGDWISPEQLLEMDAEDPDDVASYHDLVALIDHHKTRRGRFVYVQTPGIFEALNDTFGLENHLTHLLLKEDLLREVYRRQGEWNRAFAMNCLDIGVDMVHVSDDWGTQRGLMFDPETWWKLIYPHHKITADAVKNRGGYLSLHSDGDIAPVLDGVMKLGYDVVHPWQESAGMSWETYKGQYMDRFTVMGGLCIQTVLGFGDFDRLRGEITRVVEMFRDGGLLLCTTHYVQEHCTIEELTFAYDLVCELTRGQKP